MVKRPLTRITYPVGLSARFGPPLTAVRVISPPCRGTSGCLGHIRANPQHNPSLGSGGEGSAAGDRGGVLLPAAGRRGRDARPALVRSPPGLGKTNEAMEWATHYQTEQAENHKLPAYSPRNTNAVPAHIVDRKFRSGARTTLGLGHSRTPKSIPIRVGKSIRRSLPAEVRLTGRPNTKNMSNNTDLISPVQNTSPPQSIPTWVFGRYNCSSYNPVLQHQRLPPPRVAPSCDNASHRVPQLLDVLLLAAREPRRRRRGKQPGNRRVGAGIAQGGYTSRFCITCERNRATPSTVIGCSGITSLEADRVGDLRHRDPGDLIEDGGHGLRPLGEIFCLPEEGDSVQPEIQ